MIQKMKKVIEIDLSNIKSAEELHQRFFDKFDFPGFYGMNWDAFWDTITGLIEMPDKLILKNHKDLLNKLPEDYNLMMECFEDMKREYPDIKCEIIKS